MIFLMMLKASEISEDEDTVVTRTCRRSLMSLKTNSVLCEKKLD